MQVSITDLQLELLKLYSTNLTEEELRELKKQLARYYAEKAVKAADSSFLAIFRTSLSVNAP